MSRGKVVHEEHGKDTTTEVRKRSGFLKDSYYNTDKDSGKVVTTHDRRDSAIEYAKKRAGKD